MATERREVVTVLTIDARQAQKSATDHAAALDKIVSSTVKVDGAVGKTETTLDASAKVSRRAANELENLLRSFDPLYGASQKLAGSQEQLARATATVDAQFRKGLITDEQRTQRMTMLAGKSQQLKAITDQLAKGAIGHEEAMSRSVTVMTSHAQATDKAAGSTKLAAHQVTNLTYQLQDAAVQLAGGQNPFLILMQQGPQAAGAVGGVGNAVKMIISPTGLAIGGLAALAAGMAVVVTRAVSLNSQLKGLTANATAFGNGALTGSHAQSFTNSMADSSPWFSRSDATAATKYLQQVQALAGDTLRGIQGVASDFSHVTGQELATGTKALADAFAKGYQGVKALDDQYNFLTADQLKVIRGLYQTGQSTEAARIAMAAFTKQMHEAAELSKGAAADGFAEMAAGWNKALDNMASSPAMKAINEFLGRLGKGISTIGADTPVTIAEGNLASARANLANVQGKSFFNRDASELFNPPGAVEDAQRRVVEAEQALAAARAAQQRAETEAKEKGRTDAAAADASAQLAAMEKDRKAADELTESYTRQAAAISAATQAQRDRIEIQAQADKQFSGPGQEVQKAAYISGELANRAAQRAANVRELQRETDATGAVAQAYQQSETAGLKMTAMLDAQKQARAGTISSTDVERVALMNLTKASNDNVTAMERQQAAFGRQRSQAAGLTEAAGKGAYAEKAAQDEAAIQNKYADAMNTARASGDAGSIGNVQRLMDADRGQAAYLRDQGNAQDTARQNAAMQQSNVIIQRRIDLVGQSKAAQEEELAVLEATYEMHQRYGETLPAEAEVYIENQRTAAKLNTELQKQQGLLDELSSFGAQAFDRIGSSMTEMAMQGQSAWQSMGNIGKAVLSELLQEMFKLAALNPLKNALFGGNAATLQGVGGLIGKLFGGGGGATPAPSGGGDIPVPSTGNYGTAATGGLVSAGTVRGYAGGGLITGPGTGTSDSILAAVNDGGMIRVSNGESINTADATAKYLPLITAMNKGALPKFAGGGVIGSLPRTMPAAQPASAGYGNVTVNNYGDNQVTAKERRNAQGGMDLDVMVDVAVSKKLGNRNSGSSKTLRQNFGARETLTGR